MDRSRSRSLPAARRPRPRVAAVLTALGLALAAATAPATAPAADGGGGGGGRGRECMTAQFAGFTVVRAGPVRFLHARGDRAGARAAAALAPEAARRIYPRFQQLLGRTPPRDGGERCFHGPDGALDVYITTATRIGSLTMKPEHAAIVHPYDRDEACKPLHPVFAIVRPDTSKFVLAHEIYHAFQAAFRTKDSCEDYSHWNEATATWAGDWIYPDANDEHVHRSGIRSPDFPFHVFGYPAWVFPRYLTEKFGSGVMRRLEQTKARYAESEHVDKAIPGGLRARFPEFGLYAWNQEPLPKGLGPSFRAWDRFDAQAPARRAGLALRGARAASFPVPLRRLRILSREYRRITIPDTAIRRIVFSNPAAADPNYHVRALVRRGDGSWRAENWDGRATVEFCRDDPAEDVREIILQSANSAYGNKKISSANRIQVEDSCALRYRILAVRLATTTTASASDILCGTQSGSKQFDGTSGPLPFDGRSMLEPVGGEVRGEIEGRTPATWHGHQLEGCKVSPPGKPRCVVTMPDRRPGGDGTWPVSFSVSGGWNDPEWTLRWAQDHPEVGFVDAGDDECNVHIWGAFEGDVNVRRAPRETFLRTDPVTLTFEGNGRPSFLANNPDATIAHTWSYALTFQRVDGNGNPYR